MPGFAAMQLQMPAHPAGGSVQGVSMAVGGPGVAGGPAMADMQGMQGMPGFLVPPQAQPYNAIDYGVLY